MSVWMEMYWLTVFEKHNRNGWPHSWCRMQQRNLLYWWMVRHADRCLSVRAVGTSSGKWLNVLGKRKNIIICGANVLGRKWLPSHSVLGLGDGMRVHWQCLTSAGEISGQVRYHWPSTLNSELTVLLSIISFTSLMLGLLLSWLQSSQTSHIHTPSYEQSEASIQKCHVSHSLHHCLTFRGAHLSAIDAELEMASFITFLLPCPYNTETGECVYCKKFVAATRLESKGATEILSQHHM